MNQNTGTCHSTTLSQNEAARGMEVSPKRVSNAVCETSVVIARRKGRRPVCGQAALEALRRQVEAEPDLTVAEHRARLAAGGQPVPSLTTVWRRLEDLRAAANHKPATSLSSRTESV